MSIPLKSFSDAVSYGAAIKGVCILRHGQKIRFEAPIRLDEFNCIQGLTIGAYSFMRSAYIAGNPVIGRYCSVGANFSVGEPNHPTDWLGTSSVQYEPTKFAFYKPMAGFVFEPRPAEKLGDTAKTRIGNDVWIGSNVTILKGVTVGDGAVIAAGSVVTKDVAPFTVIGGVPAKLIRNRFASPALTSLLMKLKWWEFLAPGLSGVPFHDPAAAAAEIIRREKAGVIARERPGFSLLRMAGKQLQYVEPQVRTAKEGMGSSKKAI